MLFSRLFSSPGPWPICAAGFLVTACMPFSARAVEDTPAPSLTVVRRPSGTPTVTTAPLPLQPGTLSVVRATTSTAQGEEGEEERQEEVETETIPYSALPDVVRAAAERELGGKGDYRAARTTEQNTTIYQVSAIKDGLAVELILSEEGEISFITREIPFSRLPAAVQASLRQRNPDGKFTSIQAVTAFAYTATVRNEAGQETEIRVEPSGVLQEDEEPAAVSENVE